MIDSAVNQGRSSPGSAQGNDAVQQLLHGFTPGQTSSSVPGMTPGPQPSVVVTPGQPSSLRRAGRSRLEDIYSQRAGMPLTQFGYNLVGNGGSISALQIGAVQDQYILGQGDEIVVTLRGQENATYNIFVDRDGNVTLPRLRPISATGRRFGDFRQDLDRAVRAGYIQTQDYITIGQVRQISVNVAGEVRNPGIYALSGLSTVLDAIQLAGGINKAGSLRDIDVVRDGRSLHIDLYQFLAPRGRTPDTTLRQGDRILVVPIGATIAIAGEVSRPGIYELEPGVHATTVRWLIGAANGFTIRGAYRLTILRTRPDGKREYVDASGRESAPVGDGEILNVASAVNYTIGNVSLEGNVRLPGDYALDKVRTLHDLLPSAESFLPLTYTPFGFVIREDKRTLQRKVIPFSVQQVIEGDANIDLQSEDIVHILTFEAMRQLIMISTAPENAEGAAFVRGVQSGAQCLEQAQQLRDLPRPERARFLTALKPLPCRNGTGNGRAPTSELEWPLASQELPSNSLVAEARSLGLSSIRKPEGPTQPGPSGALGGSEETLESPAAAEASPNGTANGASATASGEGSGGGFTGALDTSVAGAVQGLSDADLSTLGYVVSDYRVTIDGSVREPGDYLAAPGATLEEIVTAANGLTPEADLDAVEITSVAIDNVGGHATTTRRHYSLKPDTLASIALQRLDVIEIPSVPSDQDQGNVTLDGEVVFPGNYHILKGEKLSSVLARAGGLTQQAYPLGAVFQRPSVARLQQVGYGREADDLQKQLMASVAQGGGALSSAGGQNLGLSPEAAGFVADVITQLRDKSADGRISVIADPVALAADPQADIELQPGDRLFIPKRPSEVMVTGEVLNPGNFRYSSKLDAADYITLSGGYDRYADEDHIFVINPDGTSRAISDALFSFDSNRLAPGSVVVIPRDLKPLDLGALTVTVAKVFSDFALSAASIAVLSHSTN